MGEVFAHVAHGRGHLQLEQADDAATLRVQLLCFGGEDAQTHARAFVHESGVAVNRLGRDDTLYLAGDFSVGEEVGGEGSEAGDLAYSAGCTRLGLGALRRVLRALCAARTSGATRVARAA